MSMKNTTWKLCHTLAKVGIDAVTFVSKQGHDIFLKEQKWHRKEHRVIENGIDVEAISPAKTNADMIRLGSIGRMVSLKGQKDLLRAIMNLPPKYQEQVSVEFFGDGEQRDTLEKLASNIDKATINFHGVVTNRDEIYNNVDVMVVTSETEGLSLAMIESMSYQTPVIATNVGGNPRLAVDAHTGYLFDYSDVARLTKLIMYYVDNKSEITKHGQQARNHVVKRFSLEKTAREYDVLYTS